MQRALNICDTPPLPLWLWSDMMEMMLANFCSKVSRSLSSTSPESVLPLIRPDVQWAMCHAPWHGVVETTAPPSQPYPSFVWHPTPPPSNELGRCGKHNPSLFPQRMTHMMKVVPCCTLVVYLPSSSPYHTQQSYGPLPAYDARSSAQVSRPASILLVVLQVLVFP